MSVHLWALYVHLIFLQPSQLQKSFCVFPVKVGMCRKMELVFDFRRDDVWTPVPVPDPDPGFTGVTGWVDFAIGSALYKYLAAMACNDK